MVFYEYINIGIDENDNENDNDNENENENIKRGILIEQNKKKLDKIKTIKNCIKLNMLISDYEGKDVITYLSEKYEIYVITLYEIMINFNIDGLYKLNININGIKILQSFFKENKNNLFLPHIIICKNENISFIKDINNYYDYYENQYYKLNLSKIKNKKKFTKPIKNYYIDNNNDTHFEYTLESAKEYCITNNYSGITFQNNIYEVRNGSYIYCYNDDNYDIYTWIYI